MVIKFVKFFSYTYIMSDNIYIKFGCPMFASMVATSVVHPFDVIKVSKQLNYPITYHISHLYKGYAIGLFRQMTYSTPNMVIYSSLNNYYHNTYNKDAPYIHKFCFGFLSGGIGGAMGNPSEVMFVKALRDKTGKSTKQIFQDIVSQEGYSRFFDGYKVALMRSAVYNSIRLSVYSETKGHFINQYPSLQGTSQLHFLCGAVGTITAIVISNPVDVIKSRLQKDSSKNFGQMIQYTFAHEGLGGFYKGLFPSIFKSFPHSIISFMVLERITKILTGKEAL